MQNKVSDLASVFSTPGVYDISYMSEYPKISSNIWNQKYGNDYFRKNRCSIDKSGIIKEGNIEYDINIDDSSDEALKVDIEDILVYLERLSYLCKSIKFTIHNRRGFLAVKFSGVIKKE